MKRTSASWLDAPQTGAPIPSIIHQTFGTRDLPAALQGNVEDLRASNPGWDYRLYDDAYQTGRALKRRLGGG